MEAGNLQRRHIAHKLKVKDAVNSRYVKTEGVNPNYLQINGREISRVSIIGAVVQKSDAENYHGMTIDDGTGKISARAFEDSFPLGRVEVGDVVLVIGRPREYLGEKYLLVEIVKKIDPLWAKVRDMELERLGLHEEAETYGREHESQGEADEKNFDESPKNKLIKMIKSMDKGNGVPIDDLPKSIENVDQIIGVLLKEGDVFEVRPGKLKVLE